MKMKLGLIVLLCLLSISIVCNAAITALRAHTFSSQSNDSAQGDVKYNLLDGGNCTPTSGDPKGGGGWP